MTVFHRSAAFAGLGALVAAIAMPDNAQDGL